MINQNLLLAGEDSYALKNSLRFRSSASAYLSRTPASAGSLTTWTFSAWVKRGNLGSIQSFLSSNDGNISYVGFFSNDKIRFLTGSFTSTFETTQIFRDISAWYHIVLVWDTTQATASNRVKLYINGIQVTAFDTTSYPALNGTCEINKVASHTLSGYAGGQYFDGYQTEINFIDGQALTPSSFAETDTATGAWKPKKYAGTYGTNGFFLPFTDNSALTSGSNAGLGKDFSGNGNYWNTNNISITSGSTYDSMTDVPTLTSATAANFCTLNPLDQYAVTNSDGNLQTYSGTTTANIRGTIAVSSGKWYWEVTAGTYATANTHMIGVCDATTAISSTSWGTANCWSYYASNGNKYNAGANSSYGATYTTGDVIGVALDMDNGTLTFYKNGVSQGTAYTGLTGKTLTSSFGTAAYTLYCQYNFGQRPFAYTPPTGFKALNTFNLPDPAIAQGNKYFDATLYTGNGTTQTITNNAGFQSDFVWIKNRSAAHSHQLYDIVRGAGSGKSLKTNNTDQEGTYDAQYGYVSSLNSNGFSVAKGSDVAYFTNDNNVPYVGWQWKANGAAVTNTAGTITSQVSANTSAGFSVVTYTGTGVTGTIGHGLGVAPSMIIVKCRSSGSNWYTYHQAIGNTGAVALNLTNATITSSNFWNNTSPTSSVFTASAGSAEINGNGLTYVSYCFSEVAGYSKFGSYVGNGSADGTFVYTGFRPKFVMIKNSTTASTNWLTWDSSINSYNVANKYLLPNNSVEEQTSGADIDMLSNGFKIRNTSGAANTNGATIIFMAFAENPFKYSLAR